MYYSFIIPTLNRPTDIKDLFGDIAKLNLGAKDRLEVVLFNDGADPKTADLARSWTAFPVKYLESPVRVNSCISRNQCIESAGGDWLVFLDDDVRLRNDFLEQAEAVSRRYEAFSFRMVLPNKQGRGLFINRLLEASFPGKILPMLGHFVGGFDTKYQENKLVDHLPGANMVFSRRAVGEIRFDEKIGPGTAYLDDADFSYSIKSGRGIDLVYISDYEITHLQTPSGGNRQLDRKEWYYYYQRNKFYFFQKHFGWRVLPTVVFFNFLDCLWRSGLYRQNLIATFIKAYHDK